MSSTNLTIEEFKKKVLALPAKDQARILNQLFDALYDQIDNDKLMRLIATSVKYAKDTGEEGHDSIDLSDDELEKLTNIQDKNRLVQAHLKK